ncbi:MAG: RagB/SusD family nutrient uptake outer membrane protein [Candidatus Amulumruptor caecigallinarius]|nr:RagB/SusD family nutrient uptake outer membrane protein [Candidatus Amulumruptor caecigallinarius]MCM1397748.1 RagB/SusD family nutrient uptake outer membrane protein [Candidatus Amulumruptor caecigallinarius]MCM1454787.1 RagB/SusD family nutrient uptake outer membrane protein [bacterium]
MKSSKKILWIGLASVALAACNDLDTEIYGDYITTEQKQQVVDDDPDKLLFSVTGITGNFYLYGQLYSVADGAHFDFGFPAVNLQMDARGMDLVSTAVGYNHFSAQAQMRDASPTGYLSNMGYSYPYKQIYAANTLLATLGDTSDDPTQMFYIAQARALRAYDYFMLAQLFQFTYKGHEDMPCVPLITEKNSDQVALDGGTPRAKVSEIYAQIHADLDAAIDYLANCGVTPSSTGLSKSKRLVSLAVAYGMRARVNLVMNRWAEAEADATMAISNFAGAPTSITQAARPFGASLDETNVMWGIATAESDRVVTSGIVNWPSFMCAFSDGGYISVNPITISKTLYAMIADSDVRKGWWINDSKESANLTADEAAWMAEIDYPAFTSVKFAPYQGIIGNSTCAQDIPLMRIEEMHLIKAEAKAMGGNAAGGLQDLITFVNEYRDPSYPSTAISATPQDVQDAVWIQRRIELWGEGMSYFDIMRLKKGIDRRGGGWPANWTYVIDPESNILRLPLPNSEIQANKFISEADNNPSSPTPTPVQ